EDEEVATAAGGIEQLQRAEMAEEGIVIARPGAAVEAGLQLVEQERADELEDVAFAGVVRADLPAGAVLHDPLEEGAEDDGADGLPLEAAALEQGQPHRPIKAGEAKALAIQTAVDVGEGVEFIADVARAVLSRRVEDFKEVFQLRA